jgi:protein SCO1
MTKIPLAKAAVVAVLAGTVALVRADDMGNMQGMDGGGMKTANSPVQNGAHSTKSYLTAGVVKKITPDRRTATIDTENIPGYMDAMTMDYPVTNTNEVSGILPGDKITFTLVVTRDADRIQGIHCVGHEALTNQTAMPMNLPPGTMMPELKTGDELPDGTLIAQDGRNLRFSEFRGQALAFTFFYTRCPLPNYCPLMNRNFAGARDIIGAMAYAPTNWEFLSISFDPENDTPQVLRTYGGFYENGNPAHWLFAAASREALARLAPALDLMVVRQGGSISHNLRTVVLDTRGRIYRQFDGNQWTPRELANAVVQAARQ